VPRMRLGDRVDRRVRCAETVVRVRASGALVVGRPCGSGRAGPGVLVAAVESVTRRIVEPAHPVPRIEILGWLPLSLRDG